MRTFESKEEYKNYGFQRSVRLASRIRDIIPGFTSLASVTFRESLSTDYEERRADIQEMKRQTVSECQLLSLKYSINIQSSEQGAMEAIKKITCFFVRYYRVIAFMNIYPNACFLASIILYFTQRPTWKGANLLSSLSIELSNVILKLYLFPHIYILNIKHKFRYTRHYFSVLN